MGTTPVSVSEVTPETFASEIQASSVVVVEIWGPKCRYCLALMPQVEKLAQRYAGRAKLVTLDSSKFRNFCLDLKVVSLPTFLFFRGGKEIQRLSGSTLRIESIEAVLRGSVGQAAM
jgi:thioredoxin 1